MGISNAAIIHRNVPPDWYKRGIKENLGQRFWHYRRFRNVSELISSTGGKILDIGSADGTFSKVIFDQAKADLLIGIDVLPASVAFAKKRFAKNKKLKFLVADAEKLPFKDSEFDGVFCLEVLEHVFSPKKVLAEIKRVLKKDGYAIFLVPTENFPFKYLIWPFWENTRGWIWKGTHLNHFPPEKLKRLIQDVGFEILIEKTFLFGMLGVVKAKNQ